MDNANKFDVLRKQYKEFVYEGFNIIESAGYLELRFDFHIDDRIHFHPLIRVPVHRINQSLSLNDPGLRNIVFHIGMIELVSYWKAVCPIVVRIKPYSLTVEQVMWWKKLYFNGLGEFFHLNRIRTDMEHFMTIVNDSGSPAQQSGFHFNDTILVPVGGGKDSSVTLELLTQSFGERVIPFILNSRGAIRDVISRAGIPDDRVIEFKRIIDPVLIDLNNQGYLNGHTPFSALLGFVTLLASVLSGSRDIVLSNESSADEATDAESGVNHQYSKTYVFENDFREYVTRYINPEINYFSFLRPLKESGISLLFSQMPQYFDVFRSCNAGSKTNSWCCNCPKCLFTAIILSPFIEETQIVKIFGKNILEDASLLTFLQQLTGETPSKPFECVGTIDEVRLSLAAAIKKNQDRELPLLLRYFYEQAGTALEMTHTDEIYRIDFSNRHFLRDPYLKILRDAITRTVL